MARTPGRGRSSLSGLTIELDCDHTIRELQEREDLTLVDIDYEVEAIKDYFGHHPDLEDFGGFFVKVEEGDYTEVWGYEGIVPWLHKRVCEVEWER